MFLKQKETVWHVYLCLKVYLSLNLNTSTGYRTLWIFFLFLGSKIEVFCCTLNPVTPTCPVPVGPTIDRRQRSRTSGVTPKDPKSTGLFSSPDVTTSEGKQREPLRCSSRMYDRSLRSPMSQGRRWLGKVVGHFEERSRPVSSTMREMGSMTVRPGELFPTVTDLPGVFQVETP